jgi:broad specificity phosphatase PhoE
MKTTCNVCTSGEDSIKILPEYSIFEFDMWAQDLHSSLPDMEERKHYFPRLDSNYDTMFVPSLPEDRTIFFQRCEDSMKCINKEFFESFDKGKQHRVILVVTHAACCIGLVRAATGLDPSEINPAAPCGIYKLTRSRGDEKWNIDHYSKTDGLNGFTGHLEDLGTSTKPWNHFGDKDVDDGYTGPSPRRF